ncbi:MAG: transposase [Bacteroidales bacterium]|nr:transposase [Bacteroidales bacterium]HOY39084.1 transposase [Bacteroidales bacterium]HQP05203.1 transposase [Bacteroidales bacterium]
MSGDKYIIRNQNAVHFLTFTVIDWVDVFTRKEYKLELVDAMNYCIKEKGLIVYAWVIMSNHIHCLWQASEGYNLSGIIRDYKKFTAKKIIKLIEEYPESRKVWMLKKFAFAGKRLNRITKYKFWKDDNHAIEIDSFDTEVLLQKLDYIHNNPVKSMIVLEPQDYVFSSAKDYCNEKGLVDIIVVH